MEVGTEAKELIWRVRVYRRRTQTDTDFEAVFYVGLPESAAKDLLKISNRRWTRSSLRISILPNRETAIGQKAAALRRGVIVD